MWEAQPYESGPDTPGYSEFMFVLEGSVTLVDADGRQDTFTRGDAMFVAMAERSAAQILDHDALSLIG